VFVFRKVVFKLFYSCLLLEKLVNEKYFQVNRKHFLVKEKFSLISMKVFSFYFGLKTFSRSCENFKNIILFADYVKFGPQNFYYYIFYLNLFFLSNSSLKIWFNLIFFINYDPYFYNCYLLFTYYFLNWNFLSIKFDPSSFNCYLFYLK